MIGVFDSGLGGVQTLRYLRTVLPNYDFFYLGDTAFVPYGEKSGERIRDRTFQCLEYLFSQGCVLVIMACNTASAFALRERQETFPDRKVLSVTVPGVEAIIGGDFHAPLLVATKVTIETHIYEQVRQRAFPNYSIEWYTQIGTGRVDALESGVSTSVLLDVVEQVNLQRFLGSIDCLVLGCTHYPLLMHVFEQYLPGIPIIDPAAEAAKQLHDYLDRHKDIAAVCTQKKHLHIVITGDVDLFSQRIALLWGMQEKVIQVLL